MLLQSVLTCPPAASPALWGFRPVPVATAPASCVRWAPSLPRPVRFSPMSLKAEWMGAAPVWASRAVQRGLPSVPLLGLLPQVLPGMPFSCSSAGRSHFCSKSQPPASAPSAPLLAVTGCFQASFLWALVMQRPCRRTCVFPEVWDPWLGLHPGPSVPHGQKLFEGCLLLWH